MPGGLFNTRANAKLDWLLFNGAAPSRPDTGNLKVAPCTTAPTDSSPGTELSGTGYNTGGEDISFGAAASRVIAGDDTAPIVYSNTGGSPWPTITGFNVHDNGTFPGSEAGGVVYADGLTINVPAGADLEISLNGFTVTEG